MSYLLQGSGSILSPCLAQLLGREAGRVAPCVCVRCSHHLAAYYATTGPSTNSRSDPSMATRRLTPSVQRGSWLQYSHLTGAASSNQGELANDLRQRFPTSQFRAEYFTSFPASRSPLLLAQQSAFTSGAGGISSVPNVRLAFTCAPDVSHTGIQYRFLHTTNGLDKKASSKVEETVIRLKQKQMEALSEISKLEDLEKKVANVIEKDEQLTKAVSESNEAKKQLVVKKSAWQRFVEECKHYYSGFKLLFLDVKVSSKIIWKVLQGETLSRRESRQLVRTVSDLFRLVPFSVFIIVPFMELLLPVALKLFPGMLPSTFTTKDERETKMRRTLKAKLEYAKFLQQTLDEMGPMGKGHKSQSASDFVNFYNEVRQKGTTVTNKDIIKFSKLFEDEITLDNMTRGQLVAICRLLELTPIGTNAFLRFQIEMQLRKLKADDKIIAREGIETMSVAELQVACRDRGMRALGLTQEKLRTQLTEWIELSTNGQVPPSLLLLSRTLYLPPDTDTAGQLAAAVSVLPEAAATGAKAKLGEREGKIENVTRLEVIKQEQAKIEEEALEKKQLEEERKKRSAEEQEKLNRIQQEALEKALSEPIEGVVPPPSPPTVSSIVTEASSVLRKATVSVDGDLRDSTDLRPVSNNDDIHVGLADVIQEEKPDKKKEEKKKALALELSGEDLDALRSAIETITKEKGTSFVSENEVLSQIKQELVDYEEDLGELEEEAEKVGRKDLRQTKGAARLFKRVNTIIKKIGGAVKTLENHEKQLHHQIDELEHVGAKTQDQEGHLVTVQDLLKAVRGLQQIPDSSRLERIGEVISNMDVDSDGVIKVEHVNQVIKMLGQENVHMSAKQVKQIIELIGKEELIEVESRIEKVLGKMPAIDEAYVEKMQNQAAEELVDKAKDITEEEVPEHISHVFSRPTGDKKPEPADVAAEKNEQIDEKEPIVLSRTEGASKERPSAQGNDNDKSSKDDNSVKDVTDQVAAEKEELESVEGTKVTQKNGSNH